MPELIARKKPSGTRMSRRGFTVLTSITVAIGGLLFGYDTAVISGAILFVREQFHLSSVQTELAVSIVLAGAFAGAAVGGYLGDLFGRKPALALTAITYGVFAFLTGAAKGLLTFVVARFFVGIAVGVSSMLTPLYIAEIAPANSRGALVTLNQLAITTGVVVAFYVDYLLAASGNWRWMFMSAVGPAIVLLVGLLFLPETPRWMATRGRFDEARRILTRVETPEEAERNLAELRKITEIDKLKFRDLFAARFRKPLLVGIGLAVFQQVTGVNTIIYYAPTIFQIAGFQSASRAIFSTVMIGIVAWLATIVSLFLLDRIGRRPLLLASIAAMGLSLILLALLLRAPQVSHLAIVIAVIAYIASFGIGLGPVFWLLISEIYPTMVRAQAMSVATVTIWAGDFLVTMTFLTLVETISMSGSFLVYAALCAAALVFCLRVVPETKGRTLEEIEASWR